jgi:RNA polymerase sigma-70 factor (ECF subfamily)
VASFNLAERAELSKERSASRATGQPAHQPDSDGTGKRRPSLRPAEELAAPLDLKRAFYEHAERIQRFLERLGHGRPDAEDLTSEVFLIAHEKIDRFDGKRPVLPWLFGIAVNVSRKQRRRQWMKKLLSVALAREEADDASPDLEHTLLQREDAARVRTTLEAMANKKKVILVMRECEELSAGEIGAALGMPESSVYTALHYARKEFLRLYRQRLFLEGSR